MSDIVIVDTSVFLLVLDVPGFNGRRDTVIDDFSDFIENGANLLLPMAAIIESGNHIAQLADGGNRRRYGEKFCVQVKMALSGDAPWKATQFPTTDSISSWIDEFPDSAMRGVGIADLSIIKEWDAAVARHPYLRVVIWSLDGNLAGYDHQP